MHVTTHIEPFSLLAAALSNNDVLDDYLNILRGMKNQMDHVQSFLDAHIDFLEEIREEKPGESSYKEAEGSDMQTGPVKFTLFVSIWSNLIVQFWPWLPIKYSTLNEIHDLLCCITCLLCCSADNVQDVCLLLCSRGYYCLRFFQQNEKVIKSWKAKRKLTRIRTSDKSQLTSITWKNI